MAGLKPVPFYFMRHGETDWNRQRIMQGFTDTELNDCGARQAGEMSTRVATLPIVTVCCSPFKRARRTAELATAGRTPIVPIDELKECSFGIYEGQSSAGAWREQWREGKADTGGESFDAYVARALRALNQALEHPGPVLVVAHGGTFWAVERHALGGQRVRVPNCALFELRPDASGGLWSCTMLGEPASPSIAIGESKPSS